MAEEQVRIDLTATDKASKVIDHVADETEALEKLDPEVHVTADDDASRVLGAVADDAAELERADPEVHVTADDDATPALREIADRAEALERADPEVHVTADDDASRVLEDVADEAAALTRADHELILKARIDDARAGLKSLRDDLEQTADKAETVERRMDDIGHTRGPGLAGNAVADLTGPLGEASSAASDIAGVFEGLGDVAGSAAARVGLDAEKMAGAITGIGFAVTAAAAAWAYFRQRQQRAREEQRELVEGQRDLNKAIAEGDRAAAAAKFAEMYADAIDAAAKFGENAETATRFIRGQSTELPALEAEIRRVSDAIDDNGGKVAAVNAEQVAYLRNLEDTRTDLRDARDRYRDANGALAEQDRKLADVGRAFGSASDDADDFATSQDRIDDATRRVNEQLDTMRGKLDMDQALLDFRDAFAAAMNDNEQTMAEQQADVIALKQAIVDAGEDTKKSPWQIQTELDAVDAGDMEKVRRDVEAWYLAYPVTIASRLDRPGQIYGGLTGTSGTPRAVVADTPTIGVLNMTLPAGWRGDPIRTAHAQRRRSGRYYARLT